MLVWLTALALFTLTTWWRLKTFVLRVGPDGIYRDAGWTRRLVKWRDISCATAEEPGDARGQEYIEGLVVVLRDGRGRALMMLEYDLGGGFPEEQVTAFKQYVRAQLRQHQVPMEGEALAWINWV